MRRGRKVFPLIAIVFLSIATGCRVGKGDASAMSNQSEFTVRIVRSGENSPDGTLVLYMDSSGCLSDMDFHDVQDTGLQKALSGFNDTTRMYSIKLVLSDEKNTSLSTLGRTLAKIKKATNPKVQTTVLVYLESLSPEAASAPAMKP